VSRARAALLLAIPAALAAAVVEYRIAPSPGTSIQLKVQKTGLMRGREHTFDFPRFRGVVRYDFETPARSSVDLELELGSMQLLDTWVSDKDHKKILEYARGEMLAIDRFPTLRFVSTKVIPTGDGAMRVPGNLTIRDVTKPVEVQARVKERGDGYQLFEGRSVFPMTAFGLKPPSAALGLIGTKDEMEVKFVIRAERAPELPR